MSDDDNLRGAIDDIAAGLRPPLEAGLRQLAVRLQRHAEAARDRAVVAAVEVARAEERRQAERQAEERIGALREAAAAEVDAVRRGAQAQVADLQRLLAERQSLAQVERRRWWQSVHTLDEARGLSEVLDRLAELARDEAARVSVFLVRGDRLTLWRAFGFDVQEMSRSTLELAARDAGFVATAMPSARAAFWLGGDEGLPPFAAMAPPRSAGAFPITMGGTVVALLYADAPSSDLSRDAGPAMLLDVLVRHASRVLEALTVQRAVGLTPAGEVETLRPQAAGREP